MVDGGEKSELLCAGAGITSIDRPDMVAIGIAFATGKRSAFSPDARFAEHQAAFRVIDCSETI